MRDPLRPAEKMNGDITINAPIKATYIVAIGQEATVHASISQGSQEKIDLTALQKSLEDLYLALRAAHLPIQTEMDASGAISSAAKALQPEPHVEALATHLKQAGDTLRQAGVTIEEGSQLASAISRIAQLVGPLMGGALEGARIVTHWFGVPWH